MAEGDGSSVAVAGVDASDVFNPKQLCGQCGTENDIAATRCKSCGNDFYAILDRSHSQIEIERDTSNGANMFLAKVNSNSNDQTKKSFIM